MFHAVIRTDRDAFHLIADCDAYGLETLQQHVRSARHQTDAVSLQLSLDALNEPGLSQRMRRWLQRLAHAGVIVEIVDEKPAPAAADGLRQSSRPSIER
jgi:hypothetical protein